MTERQTKTRKEWWQDAFDGKYLKAYADTVTPARTQREIKFLKKILKLKRGMKILDLACGYGRHAIKLAKLGCQVTGLDSSKYFIELANKNAGKQNVTVKFILGDMRNLAFVNKFDVILSMFTSFGYFHDESDHALVLRKISRALKPDGRFLIDTNNGAHTLVHMLQEGKYDRKTGFLARTRSDKLSNGFIVTAKDEFNPETMRWFLTRTWSERGKLRSYKTNVRVFSLLELKHLMKENGLSVVKVWGDFLQGSPFDLWSRRMIVLAKKSVK